MLTGKWYGWIVATYTISEQEQLGGRGRVGVGAVYMSCTPVGVHQSESECNCMLIVRLPANLSCDNRIKNSLKTPSNKDSVCVSLSSTN